MNEEYLKGKTKRQCVDFVLIHTEIEYDKTLTKSGVIRQIMNNIDKIKSYPDDYVEPSVCDSNSECDNNDESLANIENTTLDAVEVELEVIEKDNSDVAFKPKWTPTYRRGDDVYQPVNHDDIHSYLIGRRDSHELQTIAHWVKIKGELMVHDALSNSFVVLS